MSSSSRLTAEDVRRVEDAVRRHPFPDYVTGFDVEFGEFDGDPALWVFFKTRDADPPNKASQEDWEPRVTEMNALVSAVRSDLLDVAPDRLPYFRFVSDQVAAHTRRS